MESSIEETGVPEVRNYPNAKYCKKYRSKKGGEELAQHRERERERVRKHRESRTNGDIEAARKKDAERKRLYRLSKKQPKISNSLFTPIRPQVLGKVVSKLERQLPQTPQKREAVVSLLSERYGPPNSSTPSNTSTNVDITINTDETIETVTNFYLRSDIVYTAPGMKDTMTFWVDGKKRKETKLYMTMFIREAHSMFTSEFPELSMPFSKFAKLRPQNVLLLKDTPADQCRCKIHDNYIKKLEALKIDYHNHFWAKHLCNDELGSPCWSGDCLDCSDGQKLSSPLPLTKIVHWKEWELDETQLRHVAKDACVGELFEAVISEFSPFLNHVHIKRVQAEEFKSDKDSPDVRTLQIDWAMNYSCEYQEEVQSALWSRASISLFTAAVMHQSATKTFLICSDTKDKGKKSMSVFVSYLYKKFILPTPCSATKEVIWSDYPSAEFKNRFSVKFLQELCQMYGKDFQWKFSATSHGKGVVDGVCGKAKSMVRAKVMSRSQKNKVIVQSSEDFANVARDPLKSTKVIHISQKEIDAQSMSFDGVDKLKGIEKAHIIRIDNNEIHMLPHARSKIVNKIKIEVSKVSPASDSNDDTDSNDNDDFEKCILDCQESIDDDKSGQFYCIYFDERKYWGRLIKVFAYDKEDPADQVEIKFLHYKCGYYDFPKKDDWKILSAKYVFYGPCTPSHVSKMGYQFSEDGQAEEVYKYIKNKNK